MYSRLKISSRLRWGFAILLALLVLVGLLGIYEVNQASRLNHALYDHPFTVSNATQRLATNSLRMQVLLDQMLAAGDPASLQAVIARLEEAHRKVEQDLKLVAERYLGPGQDVTQAEELYRRWIKLHRRVSRLMKEGRAGQALELLARENRPLAAACQAAT